MLEILIIKTINEIVFYKKGDYTPLRYQVMSLASPLASVVMGPIK